MLLGIPYHAARLFSPGWGPPQAATSAFCDTVAQTITAFRMPAFFLIAGYFAAMLLARTARWEWLQSRLKRLGIPLLSATIVLIPLQLLVFAAVPGGDMGDVLARLAGRLSEPSSSWISHLWFLDDLIIYSVLIAVAWPIVARLRSTGLPLVVERAPFASVFILVGLVAVPLSVTAPLLGTTFLGAMANRLMYNGLFFLIGTGLFLKPAILDAWLKWRWWRAAVVVAIIALTVPLTMGGAHYRPAMVAGACAAIGGAWLVLAAMKRWGDAPSAPVKLVVDASLTIYLVHHPIILALGLVTASISLPVELEWLAVGVTAALLSFAIYLAIRQVPLLYYCFNGQRLAVRRPVLAAA